MKRKARYKKKAELGIQEALLNSSKYTDSISDSSEKLLNKQAQKQGVEDMINNQTSQFTSPLGGKLGALGNTAGNLITDKSFNKDGSVKTGRYALGKATKYGSTGAQIGSNSALMAATGGLSAPIGAGVGLAVGAVSGAMEAKNINYQNKENKKQQKTLDGQLRIQNSMNDRIQANQAKDGKKSVSIPIDEMVDEHENLLNVLKTPSKKDDKKEYKKQNKELQKYKKLDKKEDKEEGEEEREIETEGREPIFSPKKKDGSRDLLYYNPNDPTHKEGGVKAKVVPKSKYKMKSGSKGITIPEKSAIVTAKGGKNKEALKAYKNKDYKKLDTIINQMPEDKPSKTKKYDGSGDLYAIPNSKSKNRLSGFKYNPEDQSKYNYNDTLEGEVKNDSSTGLEDTAFNRNKLNKSEGGINSSVDKTKTKKYDINGAINKGIEMAPAAYNIGKGLFGKVQKTERNYFNPETYKYRDSSDPLRKAAQDEYLQTREEIRRGSPNASSYLANAQQAANQRYKRREGIETNEAQRRTDISNQNTDLRNQASLTNINLKNQYNDLDLQNKARKDDYLGKGLEQASSLAQMGTLNKNRKANEDILTKTLASRNYKFNKNTGDITTYKSGTNKLKPKYKKKK